MNRGRACGASRFSRIDLPRSWRSKQAAAGDGVRLEKRSIALTARTFGRLTLMTHRRMTYMKRFNPARLGIVAALACAGAWTSGALAQEQPAAPAAAASVQHDPMARRQHMEEARAARLKALHDALNIRPNQETAFSAYAAAMAPPAWRQRSSSYARWIRHRAKPDDTPAPGSDGAADRRAHGAHEGRLPTPRHGDQGPLRGAQS